LSDSDNTDFFTTPDGRKIPGKWGHLTNSKTGNDFKVFEPKDPLSSIKFNVLDWGNADLLPCRLGCDKLVYYKFKILSDGYVLQYPVNPETGIDSDGEVYVEPVGIPNNLPDTSELMHICHFDSKEFNPALNDAAFSLLSTHFEDAFRYPNISEQIGDVLKKLSTKDPVLEKIGPKTVIPFIPYFKTYLNAYPGLCIRDSYSDDAEEDLLVFPLLTLIEYYIEIESWSDAYRLHGLQQRVFAKFFNEKPELKPENYYQIMDRIRTELFDKKITYGSDYSKDSQKEKEGIKKEYVDEKVTKTEFKLKNFIRKEFPNWDREIPYHQRDKKYQKTWGKIANEIKENQLKKSSFAKERADDLDWLSFGDALAISKFYDSNPHLYKILEEILHYRNSSKKGHPYETDGPADQRELGWVDYKCDECEKEFTKLELR